MSVNKKIISRSRRMNIQVTYIAHKLRQSLLLHHFEKIENIPLVLYVCISQKKLSKYFDSRIVQIRWTYLTRDMYPVHTHP